MTVKELIEELGKCMAGIEVVHEEHGYLLITEKDLDDLTGMPLKTTTWQQQPRIMPPQS